MPVRGPVRPGGDIRVEMDDSRNGRLSFRLSLSAGLSRYFNTDNFFVKYDEDVGGVSESILNIPVVANLAPVAWATGADLHVKHLDATFLESLRTIKGVMKGMYPDFSCAGDIMVENPAQNRFARGGSAQLFTGGIDSLATYIRHRDEKPDLISLGVYTPLNGTLQQMIYEKLSGFARQEAVAFHKVESNLNGFLNQEALHSDHGRYLHEASWWATVQHGMGLLGLCAPLTAAHGFGTVYIGSSMAKGRSGKPWRSWGSHPMIDGNVAWADVKCGHDGVEWSRQEKIRYAIRPYIEKTGKHPPIIVCNDPGRGPILNCGRCEKCSRTIVGLALENIDPNKCELKTSGATFGHIKRKLLLRRLRFIHKQPNMWRDIQSCIPAVINDDMYGSRAFFEWLKGYKVRDDWNKDMPMSQKALELLMKLKLIP